MQKKKKNKKAEILPETWRMEGLKSICSPEIIPSAGQKCHSVALQGLMGRSGSSSKKQQIELKVKLIVFSWLFLSVVLLGSHVVTIIFFVSSVEKKVSQTSISILIGFFLRISHELDINLISS